MRELNRVSRSRLLGNGRDEERDEKRMTIVSRGEKSQWSLGRLSPSDNSEMGEKGRGKELFLLGDCDDREKTTNRSRPLLENEDEKKVDKKKRTREFGNGRLVSIGAPRCEKYRGSLNCGMKLPQKRGQARAADALGRLAGGNFLGYGQHWNARGPFDWSRLAAATRLSRHVRTFLSFCPFLLSACRQAANQSMG